MAVSEKAGATAKSGLAGGGVLERKKAQKAQITLPSRPCWPPCPRETPSGGKGDRFELGSKKKKRHRG